MAEARYEITLPNQFFADVLAKEIPEYIEDCQQFPDYENTMEMAFRRKGWPSVKEVIQDSELARLALDYYAHELLLQSLGDLVSEESPGFVINTIDSTDFVGDAPRIVGYAGAASDLTQYQDM